MRPLTIAFLAALIAANPLYAASKDADTQDTRSQQQSKKAAARADKARADKPVETNDNTQECKQQAHGLSGPERSRFMTKCLRQG
jgi:ABC-type microcin C transport system duplicated ATPase subunit YejF